MQIGDRRTDNEGTVWEIVEKTPSVDGVIVGYSENIITEGEARLVRLATEEAARQAEIDVENARVASLCGWDNKYILLCRSLGLSDVATTEEIQVKLTSMKNEALATNNLVGALQAIELGLNFLAIINAITQMGGKYIGIKWHEGY
jgi:hypothetical protein